MDERIPKRIPFTVISADKAFLALERQMRQSGRRAVVVNPHTYRDSPLMIYKLIESVYDA